MWIKKPWVIGLAVLAVALGVGALVTDPPRPGSPEVYERIQSEQDCDALRTGLTKTRADAGRRAARGAKDRVYEAVKSYADAYEKRIDEVGC